MIKILWRQPAIRCMLLFQSGLRRILILLSGRGAYCLYYFTVTLLFISAFFLVPFWGSRETILLAAQILLVIALLGYRRQWWLVVAWLLPPLVYWIFSSQLLRADAAVLYETESQYQFIQVQDDSDRLKLVFNEGLGTQSYFMKDGVLTGSYYDYLAMVPQFFVSANNSGSALVIGLAGGTLTRAGLLLP